MINSMVAKVLSMFLSDYFENPEKLTIRQLLTGTVTLHNLKIKSSVLSYLMLPMKLSYGMVRELEITIPWLSLATKPIMVEVKDVILIYYLTPTNEWDANELNSNWKDFKDIETLKEKSINIFLDSNTLGSKWNAIMYRFLRNAIVSFHNIDLLFYNTFFGDTPFILGFKCMTAYNIKCNSEWEPLEKSFSSNTAYTTDYTNSNEPSSDLQIPENSSSLGSSACYEQSVGLKSDLTNMESDKKLEKLMENGILVYNLFIFENTMLYYRELTESDDVQLEDKTINEVSKWIRDTSDGNTIIYRRESFQLRYRVCNGPINDEILNILACDSMLAPNIKTSFSDYSGNFSVNDQIDQIRSMINSDRVVEDTSSVTDKSDSVATIETKPEDPKKRKWLLSRLFGRKKDPEPVDHLVVEEPPKYQTNLEIYQNIYKLMENKFMVRARDSRVYPNASMIIIFPRLNTELSGDILRSFDSLLKYFLMYKDVCFKGLEKLDNSKIPPTDEVERYKKEFRSMAYGLKFDYVYINSFYERYSIRFIKRLNVVLLEDLSMQIFNLYENMSNWANFKRKMFSNCYTDNSRFFKQKTPLSKKENDILSMYRNKFLIEIMPWLSVHVIVRDINTNIQVKNGLLDFISDSILLGMTCGTTITSYDMSIENCLFRTDFKSSLLKNIIQSGSYMASDNVLISNGTIPNGQLTRRKSIKSHSFAYNIFSNPLIKDTGENEFMKCAGLLLSFDTGNVKPRIDIEAFGSWLITLSVEVLRELVGFLNYISQPYNFEPYIQSCKFQPQVRYILGIGETIVSDIFCDIPPSPVQDSEWDELTQQQPNLDSVDVTDQIILPIGDVDLFQTDTISDKMSSMVAINTVRSSVVLMLISSNGNSDMQSPFFFFDFGNIHSLASVQVSEEEDSCSKQLHGAEFQGISVTMFKSVFSVFHDDDGRIEELLRIGNVIDIVRLKSRESHLSQKILPPTTATLQMYKHSEQNNLSIDMVGSGALVVNFSPDVTTLIKNLTDEMYNVIDLYNMYTVPNTCVTNSLYDSNNCADSLAASSRVYHTLSTTWASVLLRFWGKTAKSNKCSESEFKSVVFGSDGTKINFQCRDISLRHMGSNMDVPCDISLNYDSELALSVSDLNLVLSDEFEISKFMDIFYTSGFLKLGTTGSTDSTDDTDVIQNNKCTTPVSNISVHKSTLSYQFDTMAFEIHFDLSLFFSPYDNDIDWMCNVNLFVRSMFVISYNNTVQVSQIQVSQAWRSSLKCENINESISIDLDIQPVLFTLPSVLFNTMGSSGTTTTTNTNTNTNDGGILQSVLALCGDKRVKISQRLSNFQLKVDFNNRFYVVICEALNVDICTYGGSPMISNRSDIQETIGNNEIVPMSQNSGTQMTQIGTLSCLLYIDSLDFDSILEPLLISGILCNRDREFLLDLSTTWANVNLRYITPQYSLGGNPVLLNSLGIPIYLTGYGKTSLTCLPNGTSFELSDFDSRFKIVILLFEHVFELELARVDLQVKELRFNFSKNTSRSFDAVIPIAISTSAGPPIRIEISSTLSIRNNTQYKFALYTSPLVTEFACFLNCQIAASPRNIRYDFNSEAMFNRVLEFPPGVKRIPLPWLFNRSLIYRAALSYGLGKCPESWNGSTDVEEIKFLVYDEQIPISQIDFVRFFEDNQNISQTIANPSSLRSIYRHQRREAHALHLGSKLLQLPSKIFISSEIIYKRLAFMPHFYFEVVLAPPMIVQNLLPNKCLVLVSGDKAELDSSSDVGFYNGSTGFSIEMHMPYYDESILYKSKLITVGDLRIFDSERVIEFFLYACGRGNRVLPPAIRCCVSVSALVLGLNDYSVDESLSRHVSIYAPHLIYNNQPLPLIVKSDYNRQSLRPGECKIIGLSFYEAMEFARETSDKNRFSKPYKLDSLKSFTQVYIPPTKTDSARWLTIISRPAPAPFQRSTLTIIESRFTVVNRLRHPIYVIQSGSNSIHQPFRVMPGASVAYHPMSTKDIKKISCYFTLLEPIQYTRISQNVSCVTDTPLPVLYEATKTPQAHMFGLMPPMDTSVELYNLVSNRGKMVMEERGFNEYWRHLWSRRGQKMQLDLLHPNSPKLRILFNVNRFWRARRGGKVKGTKGTKGTKVVTGAVPNRVVPPTIVTKHGDVICPGGVQFIYKDFERVSRKEKSFIRLMPYGDDQIKSRQSRLLSIASSLYPNTTITPSTVSLHLAELNFTTRLDMQFRQAYKRHGHTRHQQRAQQHTPRVQQSHHPTPRIGQTPRVLQQSHHHTPKGQISHHSHGSSNVTRRSSIQVGRGRGLRRLRQLSSPAQPALHPRTCLLEVVTRIEGKRSSIELVGSVSSKYKLRNKTDHKIYFSEPLGDPFLLRPHSSVTFGWSSGIAEYQGRLRVMISSQSRDKPFTFTCNITRLKIHAILPCMSNRSGVPSRSFLIAATLVEHRVRTLVFTNISAQRAIMHVNSENILSLRRGSVALDRLYSYLQNRSKVRRSISSAISVQLGVEGLGVSIVAPNSAIQNVQDLALFSSIKPVQLTYCYNRTHSLRVLLGDVSVDAFDSPLIRQWKYTDYWWKKWSKMPRFLHPLLRRSHEKVSQVEEEVIRSTWGNMCTRTTSTGTGNISTTKGFQSKSMVRLYISGNFEKRPFFINHIIIAIEPVDIIVNTSLIKRFQQVQRVPDDHHLRVSVQDIDQTQLQIEDVGTTPVQDMGSTQLDQTQIPPIPIPSAPIVPIVPIVPVPNVPQSHVVPQGLVYVEYFYITPLKAYVSLGAGGASNASVGANTNISTKGTTGSTFITYFTTLLEDISDTPLSFHPTFQTNIFTTGNRLLEDSGSSYLRQLVRQAAKSIGAFNILGNPIGLIRRLHFGFCEFLSSFLRIFSFRIYEFPIHLIKGALILIIVTISSILDSSALSLTSIHSLTEQLTFYSANVALDTIPIPINKRAFFDPGGILDTICTIHGSFMVLFGSLIQPVSLLYWNFARIFRRLKFVLNKAGSSHGWKSSVDRRETSRMILKVFSFLVLGPPMSALLLAKSIIRGLSGTISRIGRVAEVKAQSMGRVVRSGTALLEYDYHICNATKILNSSLSSALSHLHMHLHISAVHATSDTDMVVITDGFLFQICENKINFVCEKDTIYRISLFIDAILIYFTSHLKLKIHTNAKKFMKMRHESNEKNTRHLYKIQNKNKNDAKRMFDTLAHYTLGIKKSGTYD